MKRILPWLLAAFAMAAVPLLASAWSGYTTYVPLVFHSLLPTPPVSPLPTPTQPSANRPPVAVDDTVMVVSNSAAAPLDVLANDTDADGDSLRVDSVTWGSHGSADITPAGTSVTYSPVAGFVGTDRFVYAVSDGRDSDTATVTVHVIEGVEAVLAPDEGGSLTCATPQGGSVTLAVPSGALSETVTLVCSPLDAVPEAPSELSFAGVAFELMALRDGLVLPGFTFHRPVSVTLAYKTAHVTGLDELSLRLYRWDERGWVPGSTGDVTCRPEANSLVVQVRQVGQLALFGREWRTLRLPLLLRHR